jgi:hypothetical protein
LPTNPPTVDCQLKNATSICLNLGLGEDETYAVCVEGISFAYLICDSDGAKNAQFAPCPSGTSCYETSPVTGNIPCN